MIQKKTILKFFVVTILIAFFYEMIIANHIRESYTSPQNACINNLRYIDAAKNQWAMENHKTNGPVSWNDILPALAALQREQGILKAILIINFKLGRCLDMLSCALMPLRLCVKFYGK